MLSLLSKIRFFVVEEEGSKWETSRKLLYGELKYSDVVNTVLSEKSSLKSGIYAEI